MKKSSVVVALMVFAGAAQAFGSAFTYNNLVVVRVGDGTSSLGSAAAAVSLQEMTTTGGIVQTIPSPITIAGSITASEGFLTQSVDGRYMTYCGYNAAPGTTSIASSTAPRVVARVDALGAINASTVIPELSGTSIRSAVTVDGSAFWVAGNAAGLRYTTFGFTGATTQITNPPTVGSKALNIYNNQLYMSSGNNGYVGVNTVGSGTPITGPANVMPFPGEAQTTTPTNGQVIEDFVFGSSTVLYAADTTATAGLGGLEKWTFNGTSWTLAYRIATGISGVYIRSLCGIGDGNGNMTLFATTNEVSGTRILTLTDSIAATTAGSSFSIVATAPTGYGFRGIEFAVPAPGGFALLGLAGLAVRRRR